LYRTLNQYFREKYGHRIHKITISLPFACPNKDGSISSDGCIFCREGSLPDGNDTKIPVEKQIRAGINKGKKRFGKKTLFMAYFQTGTNTYGSVKELKKIYDPILNFKEVIGLDVGTRPDCIDDEKVNLLKSYSGSLKEIWVELGLQSGNDKTLKAINRGHNAAEYARAAELVKGAGLKLCAHMIIGIPGESRKDYINTINMIIKSGADAVKIHPYHILKDTKAGEEYLKKPYKLLTLEEYADALVECVKLMPAGMVLMRFHGEANENVLLAPDYCLPKKRDELKAVFEEKLKKLR